MLRVCGLVNIFVKKKKKKRTRIYFREIVKRCSINRRDNYKEEYNSGSMEFIQDPLWCVRRKPRCGKCSFIGEKAKRKSYE